MENGIMIEETGTLRDGRPVRRTADYKGWRLIEEVNYGQTGATAITAEASKQARALGISRGDWYQGTIEDLVPQIDEIMAGG